MESYDDILCIICLLQIIIGVLGNVLLLCLYSFNLISSQTIRPIDVIFINLAFSHILMILFREVPLAIQTCLQKIFLSDIECKFITFMQRVSRSLSLCTTCLLSIFQAISISSIIPKWAELKVRAQKWVFPSCVFIWLLNLLTDVVVPLHVSGPRNDTISNLKSNLRYCYIDWHALYASKYVMLKAANDTAFLLLMAISSSYMVLILFRHHRQVQHLHNVSLNLTASAETKATKVILLLMIVFVGFYSGSSIFVIMIENSKHTYQWEIQIHVFLNCFYSTVSPFVLISSDSKILNCCNVFKRMKNSYPNH